MGLLGRLDDPESNPFGLLAVLILDDGEAKRMMLGFPGVESNGVNGLILDVPGYVKPVSLEPDRIFAISVPSQRLADETLSLGFLERIPLTERKGWLEQYLHTTNFDPYAEARHFFLGVTDSEMLAIRNHCRSDALRQSRWTVIVSPSVIHNGGPVQCRVFIPDDGTIELGGYSASGALLSANASGLIQSEFRDALLPVRSPADWDHLPWQKIADTIEKSLSVIVYDRGNSPIGFVRIAEKVFAPAF